MKSLNFANWLNGEVSKSAEKLRKICFKGAQNCSKFRKLKVNSRAKLATQGGSELKI